MRFSSLIRGCVVTLSVLLMLCPGGARADERVALTKPGMSDGDAMHWAAKASETALTLNNLHYEESLKNAAAQFTPAGWDMFGDFLLKSGILEWMKKNQAGTTAVLVTAPVLEEGGVVDGHYTWKVSFSLLLKADAEGKPAPPMSDLKLHLVVGRASHEEHPDFIAVEKWTAEAEAEDPPPAAAKAGRLDQSHMETASVLHWAQMTAAEAMTFGYQDQDAHLKNSARFFTHGGWETFQRWLESSHTLDWIQKYRSTMFAVPAAAPRLLQEGAINGKYRWIVKFPLRVNTTMDGKKGPSSDMDLTLVITHVDASPEAPEGLSIEQWIAIPAH